MVKITDDDFRRAAANNISRELLKMRVNQLGWEIEKAILKPREQPFNHIWQEYKHIAEKNNVSRAAFYQRIRKGKWTPERAASQVPKRLEKSDPSAAVRKRSLFVSYGFHPL